MTYSSNMESITTLLQQINFLYKEPEFINRRDELIKTAVLHINEIRASQNWQYVDKMGKTHKLVKETPRALALKINKNPFLSKKDKDGELEMILTTCRGKNNYAGLYALLKK